MTLGVTGWQSNNQIQKPKVLFYQVWGTTESTPGQLAHFALRDHSWSPSSQSCTFRVGRGRNKQCNLFRPSLPLTHLCTGPTLIISLPPDSQPRPGFRDQIWNHSKCQRRSLWGLEKHLVLIGSGGKDGALGFCEDTGLQLYGSRPDLS